MDMKDKIQIGDKVLVLGRRRGFEDKVYRIDSIKECYRGCDKSSNCQNLIFFASNLEGPLCSYDIVILEERRGTKW